MQFKFEIPIIEREDYIKNINKKIEISDRIHIIGIGGTGLSALAKLLKLANKKISGSNNITNKLSEDLMSQGYEVNVSHDDSVIKNNIDLIIMSEAIPDDNIEYLEAQKKGILCIRYGEGLSYFVNKLNSVTVSGTHGKSSTTAMMVEILKTSLNPSYFCGSQLNLSKTNADLQDNIFISESCEYRETFLNYFPKYNIITSCDPDHLDYYINEENYLNAFCQLMSQSNKNVIRVENNYELKLLDYCNEKDLDFIVYCDEKKSSYIHNKRISELYLYEYLGKNKNNFEINIKHYENSLLKKEYKIFSPIPSSEFAGNLTSIFITLISMGLKANDFIKEFCHFHGIKRRFEIIKKDENIYISDYAHHPNEIQTLLKMTKEKYHDKKIIGFFEPHQYSRTYELLDDFAKSFNNIDTIYVLPIYRQRDSDEMVKKIDSYQLSNYINKYSDNAKAITYNEIPKIISNETNSIMLFIGAGEIDSKIKQIIN